MTYRKASPFLSRISRAWRGKFTALALALGAAVPIVVPISQGPLAAEAKAQIKLPKIKAPVLVPKPEKVAGCGARGQKPCKAWQAFPSCEGRLAEDFLKNICRTEDLAIARKASGAFRELKPLIQTIGGGALRCGVDTVMSGVKRRSVLDTAELLMGLPCFEGLLEEARRNGYGTLTIGGSGGAAFLIGAEGENGFAFATNGSRQVRTYHTLSVEFFSIGAGTAVNIGLYKKPPSLLAGTAHGASVGAAVVGGGGTAIWYDYASDEVAGLTAVITAGAKGKLAYVRNTTKTVQVFNASPKRVAQSGPRPGALPTQSYDREPEPGPVEIDLADLLPDIPSQRSTGPKPEFGWSGWPVDGNYRASKDAAALTRYFISSGDNNQTLWYRYRTGNGAWSKWRKFGLYESGRNYHHYRETNGSGESFTLWDDGGRIEWRKSQKRGARRFSMAFERYLGRYCDGRICTRSEWGPGAARR